MAFASDARRTREKRKWSKELTKIIRNLGNEDYTRMEKLQDVILSPSSRGYERLTKSIQNVVSDDIEFAMSEHFESINAAIFASDTDIQYFT